MHRKSSRTPALSPVAAIVLALLLCLPAAAQAQGSAGLSCGPEDPQQPGSLGAASAAPEPQCWEGMLQAHAQGNIYNDTADGKFKFTAADDDTVNGTAHIRMAHAPGTMPGGCIFTRSQDPEEFDVSIDGRRNGDLFELNFGTALATYTITTQCQGRSDTGSLAGMDAFMGGSDLVLRDNRPALQGGPAKVPAEDGCTRRRLPDPGVLFGARHGGYGNDAGQSCSPFRLRAQQMHEPEIEGKMQRTAGLFQGKLYGISGVPNGRKDPNRARLHG